MLCRDEAYDGWWEAQTTFCYAAQATEQWRRSKPKDWEPEPGQLVYAALPVDSVADQAKQNANGEHAG